MSFEYFHIVDAGRARSNNEDSVEVDAVNALAVLADGMGGYNAGEVASTHGHLVHQDRARPLAARGDGPRHRHRSAPRDGHLRRQRQPRDLQRRQLQPAVRGHGHDAGGGGVPRSRGCCSGHVGDSRAYRWRAGRLSQITRDHSLLQEQIDAGLITAEQAAFSANKNLVTRAVGRRRHRAAGNPPARSATGRRLPDVLGRPVRHGRRRRHRTVAADPRVDRIRRTARWSKRPMRPAERIISRSFWSARPEVQGARGVRGGRSSVERCPAGRRLVQRQAHDPSLEDEHGQVGGVARWCGHQGGPDHQGQDHAGSPALQRHRDRQPRRQRRARRAADGGFGRLHRRPQQHQRHLHQRQGRQEAVAGPQRHRRDRQVQDQVPGRRGRRLREDDDHAPGPGRAGAAGRRHRRPSRRPRGWAPIRASGRSAPAATRHRSRCSTAPLPGARCR